MLDPKSLRSAARNLWVVFLVYDRRGSQQRKSFFCFRRLYTCNSASSFVALSEAARMLI